jgi:hypothetical protein
MLFLIFLSNSHLTPSIFFFKYTIEYVGNDKFEKELDNDSKNIFTLTLIIC